MQKFEELLLQSPLTNGEIESRAGLTSGTLWEWRHQDKAPSAFKLDVVLQVLGYQLTIKPLFEGGMPNVKEHSFKLLVAGGRDFKNKRWLWRLCDDIHAIEGISVLINGGGDGADELARLWARERKVPLLRFDADWKKFGRSAGPRRNQQMIEQEPHLVVAFPGGRGTADLVSRATAYELRVMCPQEPPAGLEEPNA